VINPQLAEFAEHDLARLAGFLIASDTEMQAQAIDEAIQVNSLLADAAVYALEKGPNRYFVAERLHNFGSILVEPLQVLLEESAHAEVRILAALVLLRLGSKAGVPVLLEAVLTEPVDGYASLVVERLAANGVDEASGAIITRLRKFDPSKVELGKSFESNPSKDFVVSLLSAMQTFGIALPPDLQRQFAAQEMPVEITALLSPHRNAT